MSLTLIQSVWVNFGAYRLTRSLVAVLTVAQKNYDPVLPPMPDDIDNEEDSVKIIRLVKNREPLVSFGPSFMLSYEWIP